MDNLELELKLTVAHVNAILKHLTSAHNLAKGAYEEVSEVIVASIRRPNHKLKRLRQWPQQQNKKKPGVSRAFSLQELIVSQFSDNVRTKF